MPLAFSRYKYLRAPFGVSSILEHYNHRMDEAFAGLSGYRCIVDDVVIYDNDEAQHAGHIRQFLQRCTEKKTTLNTDKWQFAQAKVHFAGFALSADGYRIDQSITEAISNFPPPQIERISGLSSSSSTSCQPVQPLLLNC